MSVKPSPQMPQLLIYDSGAGGLTITKEIVKLVPNTHIRYIADQEKYPYGHYEDALIIERIVSLIQETLEEYTPDLIIIACNTASTIALGALRKTFTIPVVGVVPAIKPAAYQSKTKTIGLLCTPATSIRTYTDDLIQKYAIGKTVITYGTNTLVQIAEKKVQHGTLNRKDIEKELITLHEKSKNDTIDTIVLACTHFPILKTELLQSCQELGYEVKLIDSGEAVAKRVLFLLEKLSLHIPSTAKQSHPTIEFKVKTRSSDPEISEKIACSYRQFFNS